MAAKRFFRFSYHVPPKRDSQAPRKPLPHHLRDGDAALELAMVLAAQGYEYGDLLLNYPGERRSPLTVVKDTFLGPADLLLLTTRPPLDDEDEPARKKLLRSYTTLEQKVLDALREFFSRCNRTQVILSERLVLSSTPAVASKRNIQFRQHGGASYDSYTAGSDDDWHKPPADVRMTAAYLTYTPQVWVGGPALLAAFGMSGTETLVWTHLLRTRFSHLLTTQLSQFAGSQLFVMAEMVTTEPPARPTDLGFASQWQVTILSETHA